MLDSVDYLCVTRGTAQMVLFVSALGDASRGFGGLLVTMSCTAQKVLHVGYLG